MSLDAVLKIGGSLTRGSGLQSLCREISRLAGRYRLLIVPGGGKFADQVRAAYNGFGLRETTAHNMALLAMDQVGFLLSDMIAGGILTADPAAACAAAESGKAAILLPSATIRQVDPFPHSWQVTSDTISAWLARRTQCKRLILLKDVDGLLTVNDAKDAIPRLIQELTIEQLARHSGGVDAYFSHFLATEPMEVWVINGQHSERLVELLGTDYTTGTRIRRS
jgi:5-(aminomethyl)-3-furanmethanol phosphate kinase